MTDTKKEISSLELICEACSGHLKYRIDDFWGRYGSRGRGLVFGETGAARVASIFGWITALSQLDDKKYQKFAAEAAEDIVRHLDRLSNYGGTKEMEDCCGKKLQLPQWMIQLHDDGTLHGFAVSWYVLIEDQNCDTLSNELAVDFYSGKLRYQYSHLGGLLFHGPGGGEVFAVTLNRCLWGIHT